MIEGFDPADNEGDRRILFEVTGMRLDQNEFLDAESTGSDSSQEQDASDIVPSDYTFMPHIQGENLQDV